ncbi:MAG TPA: aspartate kinase [Candidatus Lambdaproteobacteria bacterium]|nr:aspartate kinase [Candidatus Lambdaproteobacteria bacterium]
MKKNNVPAESIIVMKFGGTSIRDDESRTAAVEHIRRHADSGKQVVVVVSAMGRKGEPYATDTLISLLKDIGEPVNPAELDSVMSIGEILSSAYFSHLLSQNGLPAQAFTGSQAGILTDDNPGDAEILEINPARIRNVLNAGKIAVVAGFQGATAEGDVRTLGRGGSDTSAVALASALNAEKVEIYSDVDGIANCDPRQISEAAFMDSVSAAQILSMAGEGSKVIHPRAIKASLQTKTPIIARNTFSNASGTTIFHGSPDEESNQVTLAHRDEMCLIEFESKTDAQKLVPEMIPIDERRFVLKNDVYLENRIKELQNKLGALRKENGWATISVVFDKSASESMNLPDTEIIPSGKNVICYLLKEDLLQSTLRTLYGQYISVV